MWLSFLWRNKFISFKILQDKISTFTIGILSLRIIQIRFLLELLFETITKVILRFSC